MVWNVPGGSQSPKGPSRRPANKGLAGLLESLKNRSGGNGHGGGFGIPGGGNFSGGSYRLALIGFFILYFLMTCVVLVTEQERGVVSRFGAYSRSLNPGLHLKMPWPIESSQTVAATKINSVSRTVPVLTNDENIVQVTVNVQYRIKDPKQYLFGTRSADDVLEQATLSAIREQVGQNTLDTVLGSRGALAVAARTNLQQSLDAYRTGLAVTELNMPNARPPEEVKPAFDDVNSAQQDKDRLISLAEAYKAKVVPEARGEAAKLRTTAEGYRQSVIANAQGDAARFNEIVPAYKAAPEATRKRMWLDAVSEVIAKNKVLVSGDSKPILYVPNDRPTGSVTTNAAQPEAAAVIEAAGGASNTPAATRPARGSREGRN